MVNRVLIAGDGLTITTKKSAMKPVATGAGRWLVIRVCGSVPPGTISTSRGTDELAQNCSMHGRRHRHHVLGSGHRRSRGSDFLIVQRMELGGLRPWVVVCDRQYHPGAGVFSRPRRNGCQPVLVIDHTVPDVERARHNTPAKRAEHHPRYGNFAGLIMPSLIANVTSHVGQTGVR
jgi:hypothetical protein